MFAVLAEAAGDGLDDPEPYRVGTWTATVGEVETDVGGTGLTTSRSRAGGRVLGRGDGMPVVVSPERHRQYLAPKQIEASRNSLVPSPGIPGEG